MTAYKSGRNPIIKKVVAAYGSYSELARILGITRQSVWAWKEVPLQYVRQITAEKGFKLHELRPDIYDAPANT